MSSWSSCLKLPGMSAGDFFLPFAEEWEAMVSDCCRVFLRKTFHLWRQRLGCLLHPLCRHISFKCHCLLYLHKPLWHLSTLRRPVASPQTPRYHCPLLSVKCAMCAE